MVGRMEGMILMDEKRFDELLQIHLDLFDKADRGSVVARRAAYCFLYDYYQKILLEVGKGLCDVNEKSLHCSTVFKRWEMVRTRLKSVPGINPDEWNRIVKKLDDIRQTVQHSDYEDASENDLMLIREKAPAFKVSIVQMGQEYNKKIQGLPVIDRFKRMLEVELEAAEIASREFYTDMEVDFPFSFDPDLFNIVRTRLGEIKTIHDLKYTDFEDLSKLTRIGAVYRIKEDCSLRHNECPKCGGKIRETSTPQGGSSEDGPRSYFYRVGCEKCNYTIHSEVNDV